MDTGNSGSIHSILYDSSDLTAVLHSAAAHYSFAAAASLDHRPFVVAGVDVAYQLILYVAYQLNLAVALHVVESCIAVVVADVGLIDVVDNTAAAVDYIAAGSFAAAYWYVVGSYCFVVAYCYFVAVSSYQQCLYSNAAYCLHYFWI